MSLLPPDEYKGGTVAETDQLVPEVEKALLQTERPNALLRQRRQGKLPYFGNTCLLASDEVDAPHVRTVKGSFEVCSQ